MYVPFSLITSKYNYNEFKSLASKKKKKECSGVPSPAGQLAWANISSGALSILVSGVWDTNGTLVNAL